MAQLKTGSTVNGAVIVTTATVATSEINGAMSAADKTKLDTIDTNYLWFSVSEDW